MKQTPKCYSDGGCGYAWDCSCLVALSSKDIKAPCLHLHSCEMFFLHTPVLVVGSKEPFSFSPERVFVSQLPTANLPETYFLENMFFIVI